MKIIDLQTEIKDLLNGVETLVQGGCMAFCEDAQNIETAVRTQIQKTNGVALVVVTPDFTRNGISQGGIPCDTKLMIRCIEAPALNRKKTSNLTALDAAEIVAHKLSLPSVHFVGIAQTSDERSGTVTATVTFSTTILLSL